MSKKIIFIAFLALNCYAASPTVWKDGEFLLWNYGNAYVAPADFCFALRYVNERIGNPNCYNAGDWERDTTVALYAKWLNANLNKNLKPEDLRPRNQHVIEKMRSLKDKNLLYSTIRNDSVWFLLFDEATIDPAKILVFPIKEDSTKTVRKIASKWFGGSPQRRLSDEERARKAREPDAYYAAQPKHDFWFGLATGWSRAKIPLTPNSWYKRTLDSRVKNYQSARDSASASIWNYLEDSSPIHSVYIGGALYNFIGLELELRRSEHKVKIDEENEIYNGLERWNFSRYELMLALEFMVAFIPHKSIEIKPYASASIVYSFLLEDMSLLSACDYDCQYRFKPEIYYRGVAFTLGLRTAFFENYAINLRTGIINRGTNKQEAIGRSTIDGFVSAGLEYHIRWID
ncbi:MAG: hypothetical protein LBC85_00150 [Fibromonadaceae bacterium]|jgi:hypothetical protein|nr:hypothetical protein [Fibromonadaceae bacterium]